MNHITHSLKQVDDFKQTPRWKHNKEILNDGSHFISEMSDN